MHFPIHDCQLTRLYYKNFYLIYHIEGNFPVDFNLPSLVHSDGKRPDDVLMVLWRSGKFLVWDAMCIDTFAPCYRSLAVQAAGSVATKAEFLKQEKYSGLSYTHEFAPIVVESSGVFGLQSLTFVKELGRRLRYHIAEEKVGAYFIQRLSIAPQ